MEKQDLNQLHQPPENDPLNKNLENNNGVGKPQKEKGFWRKSNFDSLGQSTKKWRSFFTVAGILIAALLLAWCLVAFVFQQYQVEGPSMEPTLQSNNRLIVLKLARTWSRITGHSYIPDRGDIIIFNEKNLYGVNTGVTTQLIKRVIGLPGDKVVVKDGTLTIYDKQHPNGFEPDRTMAYGKVIGQTPGDNTWIVPNGYVFVCGDNRSNSYDSRDFGPVPVSQIIGKLALRVTPVNEVKVF